MHRVYESYILFTPTYHVILCFSFVTAKTWPSKFGGRIPASKITMVIGYSTLIMFLLSFSSFLNFNVLAVISNICIFFSAMIPILISHRNKNLFVEEIKKIPSTNRDRRYYKKDLNALSKLIKLLSFRCEEVTLNELISSSRIDLNVEELKDIINDLIQKRVIKGAIESDRLIFFK